MRNLQLRVEESLSDETVLWRYMDLAKYISLLHSGAIWLSRSDTFRDQGEGRFPREMREEIEKIYEGFGEEPSAKINNVDDFQEYLCKNAYLSCWHRNVNENMVMWEIYGRDSNSVAVQTTVGKIKSNISRTTFEGIEFCLRSVSYNDARGSEKRQRYIDPFFIKRPHFRFEQEVRIVLSTYSGRNPTKETDLGKRVGLNVAAAIEKVLVHPDCQSWFIDVVKSVSSMYGIRSPVERGFYGNKL